MQNRSISSPLSKNLKAVNGFTVYIQEAFKEAFQGAFKGSFMTEFVLIRSLGIYAKG